MSYESIIGFVWCFVAVFVAVIVLVFLCNVLESLVVTKVQEIENRKKLRIMSEKIIDDLAKDIQDISNRTDK